MRRVLSISILLSFIISLFFIVGCFGFRSGNIGLGSKVALVEIKGMITTPDEVIEDLEKARKNKDVKAVVVRIDSPGGSVAASQEMFRTIKNLNEKKPVVVSMGDVAASGGYYAAIGGGKIFANEGTITGSIGVRMELMDAKDLFNFMKLKPETLKSGKFKDAGSVYRAMSEEERKYLQSVLDELHEQFKSDVAGNRNIKPEEIDKIAQGQVFTGVKAKELGLVDEIGGLLEAVKAAADSAGIKGEPRIMKMKKEKPWWVDIFAKNAGLLLDNISSKLSTKKYFLYEWRL